MPLADYHPIKSIWAFLYFLALLIFISIKQEFFYFDRCVMKQKFWNKNGFENYKQILLWVVDINKRIEICGPSNS